MSDYSILRQQAISQYPKLNFQQIEEKTCPKESSDRISYPKLPSYEQIATKPQNTVAQSDLTASTIDLSTLFPTPQTQSNTEHIYVESPFPVEINPEDFSKLVSEYI